MAQGFLLASLISN